MSHIHIRPLTVVLLAIAAVLVVIGIIYFTKSAAALPSVFPGHAAHSTNHHVKHGIAAVGLAIVALIGAWFTTMPVRDAARQRARGHSTVSPSAPRRVRVSARSRFLMGLNGNVGGNFAPCDLTPYGAGTTVTFI